jgi:hypothetical protein
MAALSVRPPGGPPNGAERQPASRSTGRTVETTLRLGKRRFSSIARQRRRHWHARVVVAVQARDDEFARIGH